MMIFAHCFFSMMLSWHADIILKTVPLDKSNDVAVLSQMLQSNAYQLFVLFRNRISVPFFESLIRTVLFTHELTRSLQSINKQKDNIQCCRLKFFQYSHHKRILSHNVLVFPLFCSPPVFISGFCNISPYSVPESKGL
jgi:hypothetical protein